MRSDLGHSFCPELNNGHKRPQAKSQKTATVYTTQGETVRLTHQQHQREHFRLSHPTPVAVLRGHDAVATSRHAGAIGLTLILQHGARLNGKCSFRIL